MCAALTAALQVTARTAAAGETATCFALQIHETAVRPTFRLVKQPPALCLNVQTRETATIVRLTSWLVVAVDR